MKPIFENMPRMGWAMKLDSKEHRFKKRLDKWVKANKKQLNAELTTCEKALKTAKNPVRIAWLWQRQLLRDLLGKGEG